MAPVADNLTNRLWVDYEVANVGHSFMVRYGEGVGAAAVVGRVNQILTFVQDYLPTSWLVTGVRTSLAGTDFSLPWDYSETDLYGFAGTDSDPFPEAEHPRELVYVGRSTTTGRRVRFSLYGTLITTPANYRFGPGESPFTNSAIFAALNAASSVGTFLTADGSAPTWYVYANVNYNSYWESERRNSS